MNILGKQVKWLIYFLSVKAYYVSNEEHIDLDYYDY